MKQRLKPLAVSLFLLGVISTPALAETTGQGSDEHMQRLEQQVTQMQAELKTMRSQLHASNQASHQKTSKHHKYQKTVEADAANSVTATTVSSPADDVAVPAHTAGAYIASSQAFPIDSDVPGKSFVSTGPWAFGPGRKLRPPGRGPPGRGLAEYSQSHSQKTDGSGSCG